MYQEGRYYDGRNAKAFTVQIILSDRMITIKDVETKSVLARWHYDDVRLLDRPTKTSHGKLGTHDNPDERLLLNAGTDWDEIIANIPKHNIFSHKISFHWNSLFFYSVIASLFVVLLFWKGPDVFEQTAYLIPYNVEQKLGNYVLNSSGFVEGTCNEQSGKEALEALLAPMMDRDKYQVHVSSDDMINAFALPGSHIVIFDGLIQNAQSPEELAGVIGHEMGHVDERHPMRGLVRQMGLSIMLQMIIGDVSGLNNIGEIAGTLRSMDYSREKELEADLYAIAVMKRANYNPYAITDFFKSVQKEEEKVEKIMKYLKYFSTHPETQERIDIINALKAEDRKSYPDALSQSQWDNLKHICGNESTDEDKASSTTNMSIGEDHPLTFE